MQGGLTPSNPDPPKVFWNCSPHIPSPWATSFQTASFIWRHGPASITFHLPCFGRSVLGRSTQLPNRLAAAEVVDAGTAPPQQSQAPRLQGSKRPLFGQPSPTGAIWGFRNLSWKIPIQNDPKCFSGRFIFSVWSWGADLSGPQRLRD